LWLPAPVIAHLASGENCERATEVGRDRLRGRGEEVEAQHKGCAKIDVDHVAPDKAPSLQACNEETRLSEAKLK
jgi:hypothetical protein